MAILKELNKRIIGLEFNFHPKYPLGMVANNDSHRKTFISSKAIRVVGPLWALSWSSFL